MKRLFKTVINWLKSLFSVAETESVLESDTLGPECIPVKQAVTDSLSDLIDSCMHKANSYHKFDFPKGHSYCVDIKLSDAAPITPYKLPKSGTVITLQHNNRKVAIGARRWYASLDDATKVAEVWNQMINASNTQWSVCASVKA